MLKIAAILDEARSSYATHNRKLKELSLLRSKSPSPSHFFSAFSKTLTPLFDFHRHLASTDRVVSFVSTFAAAADDEFLDHFLKFLLVATAASNTTAKYRACQIVVIVDDSKPIYRRVAGCFMNKFFPSGYPYRNLSNNVLSMTVGDVFACLSHLGTLMELLLFLVHFFEFWIGLGFLAEEPVDLALLVFLLVCLWILLDGYLMSLVPSIISCRYDGNSFENAPASLPPTLTSPPPSGSHHSHHHSGSSSHNKTQASDNENSYDHKGLAVQAVVGIVLGSVLVVIIVLLALVFYIK
ncbi:hypothetical protein Fmac_015766 [Flemingia macrophylla]|uniref:Uncharacterized protein n=1 Tax=Flemingia macrophylla TaxID=520843 RepID=A0ABD1MFH5_9FABA